MAVTRGRIGDVEIDTVVLGKVIDATLTIESSEITVTTHDSDDFEEFLQGRKSGSIEITCRYDEADVKQEALIAASFAETTVSARWTSRGTTITGAQQYTATAFVTSQPLESPNDEDNKIAFTLRLTGAIVRSTVP